MTKSNKVLSVVIGIVFIAVLIGAVGMAIAFIENGQKNFYVQFGNEKISYKTENKVLQKDAYNIFYCKNILGITDETSKADNFTVSVYANDKAFAACDFSTMKMDGIPTNTFLATDCTAAFDITIYDGYFILYLPKTLSAATVLHKIYPNSNITNIPEIDLYEKDYFYISVYSEQEQATVTIGFH